MAVLMTVLPGSSQIHRVASPARLSALGALAGALQRVALAPRPGLELRTRALYDMDFAGWRQSAGTSPLLAMAEQRIAGLPVPDGELVFVHGDLWLGNTIWSGDSCSGMIDWDAAGVGSPGIDLGTLRSDVALFSDHRLRTSCRMAASGRPSGRARPVLGRGSSPVHGGRHGPLPAG
jgi:aminoglycoside phosphotransferase (APT) family kinase protein